MNIEKQTSYKCDFTREEDEILDKAVLVLSDLLKNMDNVQCTFADCTQYPEIPERVSFSEIEDAKIVLCRLQYLHEIYGN